MPFALLMGLSCTDMVEENAQQRSKDPEVRMDMRSTVESITAREAGA
jgi:hypothetical protein